MAYSHTFQSPREDPAGTTNFGQSLAHGLPFLGSQSLQVALPISHGVCCAMPVLIQIRPKSKVQNSLFLSGFTQHCIYMHTHTHKNNSSYLRILVLCLVYYFFLLRNRLESSSQWSKLHLSVIMALTRFQSLLLLQMAHNRR